MVAVRPEARHRSEQPIGGRVDDREGGAAAVSPHRPRLLDERVRMLAQVWLLEEEPAGDLRILAGPEQGRSIGVLPRSQDDIA
jgi:hypothetical protein